MVEQIGGRAVLGTPFVGLLAAQILAETATGSDGLPGLMYNDGLTDGKRYSLRLQSSFGADGVVYENGSWSVTAPASTSYLLYEDNLLVPGGAIAVTVGTPSGLAPSNTVAPTVTGSAVQGQTLTAGAGTWANTPTSYAYRWLRGASAISGATASTYTLQAGDVGSQVRVGVIATNATGSSAEALSLQTAVVTAPAGDITPPTLGGTISITSLTPTSYTATCPAATDAGGVTGYQYRINAGAWTTIAAAGRSIAITGRTAGATDALEMRAFDAVPNYSAALAYSVPLPLVADTSPTVVTLDEAKLHLRVDTSADDLLITALIYAATDEAEHLMGRVLMSRSCTLTLDRFTGASDAYGRLPSSLAASAYTATSEITLQKPPVTAVESVQYLRASDGALTTLDPSAYVLAAASEYTARLVPAYGTSWPATRAMPEAVRIQFIAGYADAASVPELIKAWIKLRIGALYENRQAWTEGKAIERNPFVDRLLDRYTALTC